MFLPQGLMIGDVVSNDSNLPSNDVVVENPCLVVTKQQGFMIVPFLQLVKETIVRVDLNDAAFKTMFEPIDELRNHYAEVFGSVILPPASGLQLSS
jgi:hypothetical protein